jgi:uncharacterized protein (DUF2062 family)
MLWLRRNSLIDGPIDDFTQYWPCPFWLPFLCVFLAPQTVSSLLKALPTMSMAWLSYTRRRRRRRRRRGSIEEGTNE